MSFIPSKEDEFVAWSANLIDVSKTNAAEWGLPADQLADLDAKHAEFAALHEKCKTASYTKLDMQAKNEKKAALIKQEEVFVRNNLQNNDRMTDNGRAALRIPIHDSKPTPVPAPATIPEVEISTPLPRVVRIRFRDENSKRWGKPARVHGLECVWVIAEAQPMRIEDLLHSAFSTRSPLELSFDEDQRGKRVWFAVRWESGTVKKGKWSDIFFAVVP